MSEQARPERQRRRPARTRALVALCLATLFLVAACSTDPSVETTLRADTTTTSPPPTTTTVAPETTPTTEVDQEAQILELWGSFWEAFADLRASEPMDTSALENLASPDVVSFLRSAIDATDRNYAHTPEEEPRGPVQSESWTWARITSNSGSTVVLEACTIFSEPWIINFEREPTEWLMAGMHHTATIDETDTGWIVTDLDYQGGCVPQELAEPAIEAYIEGREALNDEVWNPPNPEHPLLARYFTEPRLANLVSLLSEHREQGLTLRGEHRLHPVVMEVHSPTELIILDCIEVASDYGLYDLETGDRLPEPPLPDDGQTGITSAHMLLDNGTWKNSEQGGQIEWTCTFGEQALPEF